ncbi:MAG: tripartite tricarboxylate transporter substrate binding protein [Thermodesulfobacteriota bacterium]
MKAKCVLIVTLCILFSSIAPPIGLSASAEKYPQRPIEVIVTFPPGGPNDIGTRAINEKLSQKLGVPVLVINKPGAGGVLGSSTVARARKDGYTLLSTSTPSMISMPVIEPKNVDYDPRRDFEPLGRYGYLIAVILVRNDSPFRSFEDLSEFTKKNPGKLSCGIVQGVGLVPHLVSETLRSSGLKIEVITAKGVPQNTSFLLGGHVDLTIDSLAATAGFLLDGKLRALAVVLEKRLPDFPDIPTLAEKGYPQATFVFWAGYFAPAGIPQKVKNTLVPALKQAMMDPEVVEKLKKLQFLPEYGAPELLRKEIVEQQRTIRDAATRIGIIQGAQK